MDKRYIYVGILVFISLLTMALITVLLLLNFLWNSNVTNGSKLVIDHDGGADDAMAIFIALIHEKYFDGPQVLALTTTFGNVDEPQAFINSQKILNIMNRRDILIYRGSKTPFIEGIETDYYYGADGLGNCDSDYKPIHPQPKHAVQALVELSKEYEGNLTVVALGSLTNIALAIKMDPEFINRLDTLYVGAGYIPNANFSDPEFNAAMDPEAYYIIAKHANPNQVTIVPFSQVYNSMNNTKEWRQSTLGAIQTNVMAAQNCFERISMENSTDWTQLDPAVMALALNSSLIEETRYANNSIGLCEENRAVNTNEFTTASEANVKILIYRGSKTPFIEGIETDYYYEADGLGNCDSDYEPIYPQPEHAVQALVELSKEYESNLTVVALGSLTNIALAIKMDPEFMNRLDTLYVGAGYIPNANFSDPEFNAAMDPEAYYIIAKHANPNQVTIVPFSQVYNSMNNTKEWRQSTLGAIQTNVMAAQNCFERISMENSTDWTQLDPAVMALALNSSLIEETRYANNSIGLCEENRAVNTNEFTTASEANVKVIYSGNREKYQDFLVNTFSAELSET